MKKVYLIHGLFGSFYDWNFLEKHFMIKGPNLAFHHLDLAPSLESIYKDIFKDIQDFCPDLIVGYSLGGRILAALLTKYPLDTKAKILFESSHLINLTKIEKQQRKILDEKRSKDLVCSPNQFFNDWYSLSMWHLETKEVAKWATEKSSKIDLHQNWSKALNFYSPASFDSIDLSKLTNSFYLCGEYDQKYMALINTLEQAGLHCSIAKNCGHNIHKQNPELFIEFLSSLLNS